MNKKYIVNLTSEERSYLEKIVSSGNAPARKLTRARILLKSDCSKDGSNWTYKAICEAFEVNPLTVFNVRKAYMERGLEAALNRKKPEREYEHRLDGEAEAHLIALTCSEAPEGYDRWSLRLLQDRFVQLGFVDRVSHETIRTTLKKNELKPWLKEEYCIPPKANAAFVCNMEDVLDVYTRPYDPKRPQVCMDETTKQLLEEIRDPLPIQPGQPERVDYEYRRQGVGDLFMFFEPLQGKRHVKVTDQRTRKDWAQAMRELSDIHYPQAEKIIVVLDNLNTHSPASFYETFEPDEARRLINRFEFHFTPKHGSWLNMAEIELSALARQCLSQRIPDQATLASEVKAWEKDRNSKVVKVDWQFTTADARIRLKHLYPEIHV
ncbi:MAG TPA: IS630 family transposase [Methylococcales bacterium]